MSNQTTSTDHLYIVSNFSQGDPDRVATPLVLSNCALAANSDVVIWLTMDGVELARKGAAETLPVKSLRQSVNCWRALQKTVGES